MKRKTYRRKYRKSKQSRRRRQRGGVAPVSDSATILTPQEQAQIFLFPLEDNFKNAAYFQDSRTPFLNVAN
jgi:hypothetical protein